MSILAFANLTSKREQSEEGTSTSANPPGVRRYVDAFAALVPTEVLTAHALILGVCTETKVENGLSVVRITTDGAVALRFTFWALLALSVGLYVIGRWATKAKWEGWDLVRAAIPPLAFIGWMMLQKSTAFDAIASGMKEPLRITVAILGSVLLSTVTVVLAGKSDEKKPSAG